MIVPDKWKEGASNVTEGGGRKVNENKLLSKKQRYALLQVSRLVHSTSMQILLSASSSFLAGGSRTPLGAKLAKPPSTRMLCTAKGVPIKREFVQCAASRSLIPVATSSQPSEGKKIGS